MATYKIVSGPSRYDLLIHGFSEGNKVEFHVEDSRNDLDDTRLVVGLSSVTKLDEGHVYKDHRGEPASPHMLLPIHGTSWDLFGFTGVAEYMHGEPRYLLEGIFDVRERTGSVKILKKYQHR